MPVNQFTILFSDCKMMLSMSNKLQGIGKMDISQELHYLEIRIGTLIATIRATGKVQTTGKETAKRITALSPESSLNRLILDEHGCILKVNGVWLRVFGHKYEEVIGRWIGDYLHPHDIGFFVRNVLNVARLGEIGVLYLRMMRHDGSIISARFNARICFDDCGIFRRIHCVFEDISDIV
ncbi:PAS domain S-box protein [bacterium]|nr:PAS domain S-box protein [bacterium]